MKSLFITIFIFSTGMLVAQNYERDAVHIATENFTGSARFSALSGAFSSVGADLSNLSHNPGGVGMYRNSSFQGSLGFIYAKQKSTFYGNENIQAQGNIKIPSLGVVFATKKPSKNGMIRNAAFALGINNLGNYTRSSSINNYNTNANASMTNIWTTELNDAYGSTNVDVVDGLPSINEVSFETYNAYYGYLVNWDSSVLSYTTPVVGSFHQNRHVQTYGSKNEFYISAGANYVDKLYFGATIGVPLLNYRVNTSYSEEDTEDLPINTFFNKYKMQSNYKMEGLGVNFKAGLIYKPYKWMRIGMAVHTPERISISENYSNHLESFNDIQYTNYDTLRGKFDYKLRLPWKANTGVSFFYKEHGFISIDYQAVGVNNAHYNFGNANREFAESINGQLKNKYRPTHQIRAGIEGVVKIVRLRAGYSYTTSPIKSLYTVNKFDFSRQSFSGGIGFLINNKIALDFAYIHYLSKDFEQPYEIDNVNISGINSTLNRGTGMVSFAYKFR